MPSLRRESSLLVAGEAVNRGSRFLLLLLIARQAGAEDFGAWVIAVGVATFVTGVCDAGIGTVVTREIASQPSLVAAYVRTLRRYLPSLLVTGAVLVAAAGVLFDDTSHAWLVLLLGFGGVLEVAGTFLLSAHRGMQALRQEGLIRLAEAILLVAGAGVVFLALNGSPLAMALVYLLGGILFAGLAGLAVQRRFGSILWQGDSLPLQRLWASAFPILLANVVFFLYLRADAVLLSLLKGSAETGLYGAAYNFVFGAVFIPYTVSRGLLPRFAACQPGVSLRKAYFRYAGLVVAFLALSSLTLLLVVPVFRLVYGPEFHEAEEPYRILVGAFFLIGLTTLNYAVLFSQGRSTVAFGIASAGLATNVVANIILIPDLAATGSALSMIISEVVVLSTQAVALTQLMSSRGAERQTRAVENQPKTAA